MNTIYLNCLPISKSSNLRNSSVGKAKVFNSVISTKVPKVEGRQICQDTSFLRYPELLATLPDFLKSKFPDGVPLEFFAASDGSTAIATSLILREILGEDISKNYPIYVSDLFPNLLARSKKGIITVADPDGHPESLLRREWTILAEYNEKHKWSTVDQYIDLELVSEKQAGVQKSLMKSICDFRANHFYFFCLQQNIFQSLQENVSFIDNPVDISNDLSTQVPKTYRAGDPRVVFFQAALYLLNQEARQNFYKSIANLPINSLLIFGDDGDLSATGRSGLRGDELITQLKATHFCKANSLPQNQDLPRLPYLVYEKTQ